MLRLSLFAGYPIYALIAAFTSFTLVPDTTWEIVVLTALTGMAVIGALMDKGSEQAALRGDRTALKYRRDWGLGEPGKQELQHQASADDYQRIVDAGAAAREQMTDEEIALTKGLADAVLRAQGWTDDDFEMAENVKNWNTLTEAERKAHFERFVLPKLTDERGEEPSG